MGPHLPDGTFTNCCYYRGSGLKIWGGHDDYRINNVLPVWSRDQAKADVFRLHRALLQSATAPFDHRISQPDGVRKAGAVSLGWCPSNRQQLRPANLPRFSAQPTM